MSDGIFLQDREILFDMSKNKSELQRGEQLFQRQEHIEDFKGNPGESGTMAVTNMRLIWYSRQDPKINLSLGYDCVSQVEVKN
jgi:Bardet-Biedl syndrome 5 protein